MKCNGTFALSIHRNLEFFFQELSDDIGRAQRMYLLSKFLVQERRHINMYQYTNTLVIG